MDISHSKQLLLVEYPTNSGVRQAYVKNVPSLVHYYYEGQYKNGSTRELAYLNNECSNRFGSLDAWENATPLFRDKSGRLNRVYSTNKGKNTKNGFVKYNEHFNKF
ncbi:hypothetical protein SAMN02745163_00536 [Clostridium cavendishii DSM 21758]|uniref:Uncharacterized protein n=1 Tax=Clostridium cavendishii DSM 21758 TaxID=1121302 RepID=A0A1M6CSL7_9CLOT|nr:hypothetical protein [Clostridium cavendishii]SHI63784.1 hypothetical protein SAMN02745163_00536 [Clostridium cavendishii DSM 21758]